MSGEDVEKRKCVVSFIGRVLFSHMGYWGSVDDVYSYIIVKMRYSSKLKYL